MILSIVLTIFSIALFVNVVMLYIEATNIQVSDGSTLEIKKHQESENIITGWIKNIAQINNKIFVFPATEMILDFPNTKEENKSE